MSKLLTDAELEVMQLLWRHGPLTAREAMGHLPDDRAYTTVATFFRILVEKGFATASKRGRAHVFTPSLSRAEYQVRKLEHVVNGLFDGSPLALVRQLVARQDLSNDEVAELKAFVENLDDTGPDETVSGEADTDDSGADASGSATSRSDEVDDAGAEAGVEEVDHG